MWSLGAFLVVYAISWLLGFGRPSCRQPCYNEAHRKVSWIRTKLYCQKMNYEATTRFSGDENRGIQIGQNNAPIFYNAEPGQLCPNFIVWYSLHDICLLLIQAKNHAIYHWLSTTNYNEHHRSAFSDIIEGSGRWLLAHEKFKHWREHDGSPILWLHGIREGHPTS